MNKIAAITVALVALAGCTEVTHPATRHECDTMHLKRGSTEYNDCIHRMKSEEAPLGRAQEGHYDRDYHTQDYPTQDGHYERAADGHYYRTGN